VAAQPVGQTLRPAGFSIGQVGGAQRGDEDLRRAHLAGERVHDVHCLPGIIDKQTLAERMVLPHGR
jgi:hypothetical protein